MYSDGFTAKRATRKQCKGMHGAIAGLLNPSELAEKYLKWVPNIALLALYCLRRFGNPDPKDTDQGKAICQWYITTPRKDVVLIVSIAGGTWLFGYLLSQGLDKMIAVEQKAEVFDYLDEFTKWAKEVKGELLCAVMPYNTEENNEAWMAWGRATYPKWDEYEMVQDLLVDYPDLTEMEFYSQFFGYNQEKVERLRAEYEVEHPFPEQYDDWDMEHNGPLTLGANQALLRAIGDLLRPCQVRDWELYATKEEPEIELPIAPSFYK